MIFSYFKTAVRNLFRQKNYSLLNIGGLAAGICICILIAVIIRFETSFDNYHQNKDRLYRVLFEYHHPGTPIFYGAGAPFPLPSIIRHDFPELEKTSGVVSANNTQLLVLDTAGKVLKKFKEERGIFAVEPTFFDMFDFKWLAGTPTGSLSDLSGVVLSRSTAEKYFGTWQSAVGKMIRLENSRNLKVTGILADPPANTDFQFRIIMPYATTYFAKSTDWNSSTDDHGCYIMLPRGTMVSAFIPKLRSIFDKYRPAGDKDEITLQSISEVHYYDSINHLQNFLGRTISRSSLRILWMVAAFILIIACVNFINLATAQAVNRAREVGVRKVMGSRRWQLRLQFLTETFVLVLISVLLAVAIAGLTIPAAGKLLDLPLSEHVLFSGPMLLFFGILIIAVTILAGFYPSFLLSRFNPIEALKSSLAIRNTKGISLRRALVVFQFIIAQALIISTIIMIRQMNYFSHHSMGFDKEAIVDVPFPGDSVSNSKIEFLRGALQQIPGVKNVSFNSMPPATDDNNWMDFKFDHEQKYNERYSITKYVDRAYLGTYGMKLVAGRNFSSDTAHEVIVNEKLLAEFGIKDPQEALNKEMDIHYLKGPIVGVVKNFNSTGFKDGYSLVYFAPLKRHFTNAGIKLSSDQTAATLKSIEKIWNEVFPDYVFEYKFLDASIENFYKQENQLAQLYKIFAGIAIFLGCLGLYGLASFMAAQRIKEVGIRKVLGASIGSIVYLFSREFILLIIIALLIASPVAGYFMHQWLQDYTFRIDISWWIFIAGGAVSVIVALATVGYRALRAATANPVESLRAE